MIVSIDNAVNILQNNDVVAMPTETVYGLAAKIDSELAIKKIFSTKERPFFDPLIVHVSDFDSAKKLTTEWDSRIEILAKKFWPGPLTLILKKSNLVSDVITSGLERVGIRMPNHSMALELIRRVGVPLAAPSANKFGKTSPTKAEHVLNEFSKEKVAVIDGGECDVGIESTVLLVKPEKNQLVLSILRHGGVSKTEIVNFLVHEKIDFSFEESVSKKESPGHMKHHYMPNIPLVTISENQFKGIDSLISLVNTNLKKLPDIVEDVKIVKPKNDIIKVMELDLGSNSAMAARVLYAKLREIAESDTELIYFIKKEFHSKEEWNGIMDRIQKASSLIF